MTDKTNIPPPAAQITDTKTGGCDQYWYDFFQELGEKIVALGIQVASLAATVASLSTIVSGLVSTALLKANNLSDVANTATSFNNIKVYCSTVFTGVVRFATGPEVVTGTDLTLAVSAANLANRVGIGRFHVTIGGTDQVVAGGAFFKVLFNTKDFDTANWFDLATDKFIPGETGTYFVYLSVSIPSLASGETTQAIIRKNGGDIAKSFFATAVGGDSGGHYIATLVQMNGTTDFIEAAAWVPTGVLAISGGANTTFMGGWKVGL